MASPEDPQGSYSPISDYALVGNCRTSALVSRDGSIDWLCLPRFDSPSFFAALLDSEQGGRFRIRPIGAFTCRRSYVEGSVILATTFHCPGGSIVVRDFFPVTTEEEKQASLTPEHEILREIEGLQGEVEIEVLYQPRPGYARAQPVLEDRKSLGLWCRGCGGAAVLLSEIPLTSTNRGAAITTATIRAGERKSLSLSFSSDAPAVIPALGEVARQKYQQSLRWWRNWEAKCCYRGPYRGAVLRSAAVLKMMIYAPSGAIIASPTTSLPEKIGGERNWDYRYCWLRDASLTLRALYSLGYTPDAHAFVDWLLHTTRLTRPGLRILYDVFGGVHLPETELRHLEGYARSRPVRIGNDAQQQFQLDVYGEVIDAVILFASQGGNFDRDTVRMLNGLGKTVCKRWREPDDGIWEGRSGRYHHTHSKVLAWVALDRLIQLHAMGYKDLSVECFLTERELLRQEIEARGYNKSIESYTSTFEGSELDASLLLLPLYGYTDAAHPRMRSTYARIREKLGTGSLLYRYREGANDGLPPGEGTFGICSFWGVECQARMGDVSGAHRNFTKLLSYGNDVGLFAEEISPDGEALGNFPQAFTHIGLINAALTLAELEHT
jgi:GH15 family glucan-1,4-alpha-glucosidase